MARLSGATEQHKANGAAAYSTSSNGAVEGAPRPLAEGPGFTALGRFAPRAVVSPALGLGTRGILDGNVCITDDGHGVAYALAHRLRARGAQAVVASASEVAESANVLISLDGLRKYSTNAQADAANRDAFIAARRVAAHFAQHGGTFITIQDTGGDFGLSGSQRAWVAAPSALARTAAIEWPRATVRASRKPRHQEGSCGGTPDIHFAVRCRPRATEAHADPAAIATAMSHQRSS